MSPPHLKEPDDAHPNSSGTSRLRSRALAKSVGSPRRYVTSRNSRRLGNAALRRLDRETRSSPRSDGARYGACGSQRRLRAGRALGCGEFSTSMFVERFWLRPATLRPRVFHPDLQALRRFRCCGFDFEPLWLPVPTIHTSRFLAREHLRWHGAASS